LHTTNLNVAANNTELLVSEIQCLLVSPQFAKAYRARALLRYFLDQILAGDAGIFNEYAIGLAVFRRAASAYSTGEDPIVRVQVGRLRQRLQAYYAGEGRDRPQRLSIPLGGYRPRIEQRPTKADARLAFEPLACLTAHRGAHAFTCILNRELQQHLRHDFGACLLSQTPPGTASHLLQGDVWLDGWRLRTSLRLLNVPAQHCVWSELIEHNYEPSGAFQERLTQVCSQALRRHLASA
jgi:hypothetical protein